MTASAEPSRPTIWDTERPCERCGKPVEEPRRCYASPVCYACLPPPEPLPVLELSRPAIHPPPSAVPTHRQRRARSWPIRLRAVVALACELMELESCALLCSGSSRAEVAYAGRWLGRELSGLASDLRRPTLDAVVDDLIALREARDNLAAVVAASRDGGAS